jgi:hypothetical protein
MDLGIMPYIHRQFGTEEKMPDSGGFFVSLCDLPQFDQKTSSLAGPERIVPVLGLQDDGWQCEPSLG